MAASFEKLSTSLSEEIIDYVEKNDLKWFSITDHNSVKAYENESCTCGSDCKCGEHNHKNKCCCH